MMRATTLLLIVCLNMGLSYGMKCSIGNTNFLTEALDSCPGLLDSSDKVYCCLNVESGRSYCCNEIEFAQKATWVMIVIIVVVIAALIFVSCIVCLCCSCCPCYRRRHRGTVYGKVQAPSVVHVIQPTTSNVQPPPYNPTIYATNSSGITQPPIYAQAVYEKQAPYNPNYNNPSQL